MAEVILLAEDDAQERFIAALIARLSEEVGQAVDVRVRSAYGGLPKVLRELEAMTREIGRRDVDPPDLVVVAVDANCKGVEQRRNEIHNRAGAALKDRCVAAVPDPHVERWYLLDGSAFKAVLGRGCNAPDQKCEKDRYKQLLNDAIRQAGVEPLLAGAEYAEDLAASMDLERASNADQALGMFVADLRAALRRLQ